MLRVRVSSLARAASCQRRARIEGLRLVKENQGSNYMAKGNKMHKQFSFPYGSGERRFFRSQLYGKYGQVFTRTLDDIELAGRPDDFKVEVKDGKFLVSIIEVKTTSKPRLWFDEINMARLQLQLYIYLMEPYIKGLETEEHYEIGNDHEILVYSQKTGQLIKRVPVVEDWEITEKIKHVIKSWREGPLTYPPRWICKGCPKVIKNRCGRFWKW